MLNVPARNREEHFQVYLSNWLGHYDCNNPAKNNFQEFPLIIWRATQKQICGMSQQGTEKTFFKGILWNGVGVMTAMILQNTISRLKLFWIETFDDGVCYFGEPRAKKSVEYRSKDWRKAFSELYFESAVALWLHWFCKKQFPDSIYVKLNILIAEWVIWRATKEYIC